MKYLLLPWFLMRLAVVNVWGLIQVSWYRIPPLGGFALSLVIVTYITILTQPWLQPQVVQAWLNQNSPLASPLSPTLTPENRRAFEAAVVTWQELYKLQPTHRDILLNLAQLYEILGDENQSAYYRQQAFSVDPNSAFFLN